MVLIASSCSWNHFQMWCDTWIQFQIMRWYPNCMVGTWILNPSTAADHCLLAHLLYAWVSDLGAIYIAGKSRMGVSEFAQSQAVAFLSTYFFCHPHPKLPLAGLTITLSTQWVVIRGSSAGGEKGRKMPIPPFLPLPPLITSHWVAHVMWSLVAALGGNTHSPHFCHHPIVTFRNLQDTFWVCSKWIQSLVAD